MTSESEP